MTITVRPVTDLTDCERVRSLAVEHAAYEHSTTVIPLDWAALASRLIHAERLRVFVAEADGLPVGYATLTFDASTWSATMYAHLDCLYVRHDYRNAGVGPLLFSAAADSAREEGVDELQWQTPSWNSGAIRFYERLGATSQAKERFTLRLTDTESVQRPTRQ